MKKVIISLAPVQAGTSVDAVKLAEDVEKSVKLGAAMCHLHCRKPDGSLTPDISFGTAKRAMLDSGRKKILVVDNTKFDQTAFSVAGRLRDVDIVVTDAKPSEKWLKLFKEEGVECRYPESVR